MQQEIMDIREAAEFLKVSTHTLRFWINQKKVPIVKLGGRVLFQKSALESLINENVREAEKPLRTQR